jgi:hypothetical protein
MLGLACLLNKDAGIEWHCLFTITSKVGRLMLTKDNEGVQKKPHCSSMGSWSLFLKRSC